MGKPEKHTFQAEVNQVLSLVVNSLYTHKEVFLRELISNSSDALDQLSFRALTEPDVMGEQKTLEIRLAADSDARTLTISDSGVGMTHDQLVENLGTIAHSGTRKLIEGLSGDQKQDLTLIGQFGVGFYAAFLVADKVEVLSRAAGEDKAWRWVSEAHGEFTLEEAERDERGTDVILHLKEDEGDFLREWSIKQLVRKYSDYVRHPIKLSVERQQPVGDETDEQGQPKNTETVTEWEQVNKGGALWTRSKSDVTDEQYDEFYKHLTHDWQPPLARTHFKVEGLQQMTGLLFIPAKAPMDMMQRRKTGMRLFVKRVFIMDDCEDLLPDWLRFMRGVVDSEDLPLNVSREFLQKDRTTQAIRKQVVKHCLRLLEELAEEGETTTEAPEGEGGEGVAEGETRNRFLDFWSEFGTVLKEGMHFEPQYRERLCKLLRFQSTEVEGLTSLDEYVERMKDDQPGIYYVTGESRAAAEGSPHLEGLRKRGYEVLLLTDPVDEWVVEALPEYEEKKLMAAAKGALDLPESDEDKEEREERAKTFGGLFEKMQGALTGSVKEVRLTDRLTDSPACLVTDEGGLSPHLVRMLKANNQPVPDTERILELNPDHAVVKRLHALAEDDASSEQLTEWSQLLYDQSLVAEGSPPSDPARLAKQIAKLMTQVS